MAARRRAQAALTETPTGRATLTVRPFDRNGTLPLLVAPTPQGGWTTNAVLAHATNYAEHHRELGLPQRRLIGAAYRALTSELPRVKRAEIKERLRGMRLLSYVPKQPERAPF